MTQRSFGLLQLWDAVAAAVPDRECVVQGSRRYSWSQVSDRTTRLGWLLTEHGHGARTGQQESWESPNDLVGLLMRNSVEYLEAGIGCYRARCAPFNVNYRYQAEELGDLLRDAAPSAMVYHVEFGPVLAAALDAVPGLEPTLVHVDDASGQRPLPGSVEYEAALRGARAPAVPVEPSPDDVHVLYTGGTTGSPKGVIWALRDLAGRPCGITVSSLEDAYRDAPRRGWLKAFPAPPLMHGAAAWFAYGAWSRGGTLVLTEDPAFDPATALDLCRDENVTWVAIIGDAFAQPLLEELRKGAVAPASLSYVFSSGAALSAASWEGLEEHFPDLTIANALGSSETGPQAVQTSKEQVGFRPGPTTCVVSEDHERVLSGDDPGVGWLASSGELPRGYLHDQERTESTFRIVQGRRLSVSGDRASIDAAGEITYLGRESSVVNTGGEKVYAEEVEGVLRALPEVSDVVVVGRPSQRWGQEVVALLVAPEAITQEAVRTRCGERLAAYKLPKAVIHVDAVRRHANGKVDHEWARRTANAGH